MFTIEHDFDATTVTLIDEGQAPHRGDVTIHLFEDQITVEQLDPRTDTLQTIMLSATQMKDLAAALDLPEGAYRRATKAG